MSGFRHPRQDVLIVTAADVSSAADPLTGARLAVGFRPLAVVALWATVTTAVTAASNTLTFKWRPTPGSATNEVSIGTLVVPTTAAIGKQLYKVPATYVAAPGGEIVIQTDGGGDAGAVSAGITVENRFDDAADADQVASA